MAIEALTNVHVFAVGDKMAVTPWDDYDFNGSKDYEYQLSYKGCRITYIEARLLIVSATTAATTFNLILTFYIFVA